MVHTVTLPDGTTISDDHARLDMDFIHGSLLTTAWAAARTRALNERAWANSRCLGVYAPEGGQTGFARVVTDLTFRAHLADVFLHPASRGQGLGRALVAAVLGHPELATVTHWTLSTSDAHGLYERFGFRTAEADGRWMTLVRDAA